MDDNDIIRQLMEMITQKDKIIAELVQSITQIQVSQPTPPIGYESGPLWVPEEEQDIRHAYEHDLITKQQMEEMLKNLDFNSTEISVDY